MNKLPAPPLAMLAEITHRCPLRCPYCSNPIELNKKSKEIKTKDWLSILDQAAELGILQVHFSGGEPTVRDDLAELIAHAEQNGLYSNLITAGVLLTKEMLEAFTNAGLQHVQLSIQAANVEIGDRIGGFAGGHEKKLVAAKLIKNSGLPLTLNAVIHRLNIDQIETIIEMAVDVGAQRLEVANVQYYGWGLVNRKALIPTFDQLVKATDAVEKARKYLEGKLVIDYVVPDYYARRPKACMGGWANRFLNVNPAGFILPCHAAETIPDLTFEHFSKKSLKEIWYDSDSFNAFRGTDWMPEPCSTCERKEIDWGGCRCQAAALTGKADATDPACELSPYHNTMLAIAKNESRGIDEQFIYRQIGKF